MNKVRMVVCWKDDDTFFEKFKQFVKEKETEGWLLSSAAYRPDQKYVEYVMWFERKYPDCN